MAEPKAVRNFPPSWRAAGRIITKETHMDNSKDIQLDVNAEKGDNVTNNKIAANRRNALKSAGPKSAAGKARSSRNSYKHGLTATFVIPGIESLEEWARYRHRAL